MLMPLAFIALLACGGVAALALAVAAAQRDELRRLRERLERLERAAAARGPVLEPVPPLHVAEPPAPDPIPMAAAPHRTRTVEELVGGLWLLNAGAVLVLLGVFFLIVWGYATGRLGPGALVAAGMALGLALAWRGDRARRSLPAFGHGLIGVGLGIVWLAIYLGEYTLHVFGPITALLALTAVSLGTVLAGLHYRAEGIAALGVAGAFIAQVLATWSAVHGFALAPRPRLGWLLVVDAAVAILAARAAWGRLTLLALVLTSFTWFVSVPRLEDPVLVAGLVLLHALFGLALLPRLAAVPSRVQPAEIAVVALAPLSLVITLWPWLALASRPAAAGLLLGLAAVWLAAALWVEPRRTDEDLWRPLTGAGTMFLAAALERATGFDGTPLAWTLEGLVLVWLGLSGRGTWLRVCGHAVAAAGALWLSVAITLDRGHVAGAPPVLEPSGVRQVVTLAVLVVLAARLGRARDHLGDAEAALARGWTIGVNVLLLAWSAVECGHAAGWIATFRAGASGPVARATLASVLTSVAWLVQATVLLAVGWRGAAGFRRWLGLALLGIVTLKFIAFDLARVELFWRFAVALAAGVAMLVISYLYQRRARSSR